MAAAGSRPGVIDVALIQSLVRHGEVSDLVADYGHLIVDECHHLSAASFELVARRSKARFVLGLSATVARRDGHHPIIFMQCGPVRHRVDARPRPRNRGSVHRAKLRAYGVPVAAGLAAWIDLLCRHLCGSRTGRARNDLIFDDVLVALEQSARRSCLRSAATILNTFGTASLASCAILLFYGAECPPPTQRVGSDPQVVRRPRAADTGDGALPW